MKRHFEKELDGLRGSLLRMGGLCEEMVRYAVKLLEERDAAFLGEVREREEVVNRLHIEIDDFCLKLIVKYQPAAGDLRLIAAALKINADLERIGDQAVNIAETSSYLRKMPPMELGDIPKMVEAAAGMLKDSLDAFARKDVELARDVIRRDDEQDKLKSRTFRELMALMRSDASKVHRALDLILVSRNLERIADHAVNIAEDVIFMVLAQDIRHHASPIEPVRG